jgi:ABC-type dipeptide/oligopeptide/nickel transport system ATPase subunit
MNNTILIVNKFDKKSDYLSVLADVVVANAGTGKSRLGTVIKQRSASKSGKIYVGQTKKLKKLLKDLDYSK